MRLEDKRILVTGGTSGLGRAMALRFAREGARVAITGRREDALAETAKQVRDESGRDAVVIRADHLHGTDNERSIDESVRALGGLDVLINNAGVIGFDGMLEARPDEFRRMVETNLFAPYALMRHAVPHLVESAASGRDASVLNVSSVASLRPYPGLLGYCTSKAALDMMTQGAAIELAPRKVRVNAINPGVVVTNLHRAAGLDSQAYEAFLERSMKTHPIGRPGSAEEVAALAAFLVGDEATWITGALHSIDGGRALTSLR
ncbi:MAG: glucose 1-dehydrogenase [Myxococcota bacterium]|nr:glucose 1-dehydrogenase [Myxococcota bacterium]